MQTVRLYTEMNAEAQQQHGSGSGATFIGFWIDPKRGACLYSVGDCYGLWFSSNKLDRTFPETTHFNNNPTTIDTHQELSAEKLVTARYGLKDMPGDMLVLCSDALAEYLLKWVPWDQQPDFWHKLEDMSDKSFGTWAEGQKAAGKLKDDDYTLLLLRFPQMLLPERVSKVETSNEANGSVPVADSPEKKMPDTPEKLEDKALALIGEKGKEWGWR